MLYQRSVLYHKGKDVVMVTCKGESGQLQTVVKEDIENGFFCAVYQEEAEERQELIQRQHDAVLRNKQRLIFDQINLYYKVSSAKNALRAI